jgi:hypothetical protein
MLHSMQVSPSPQVLQLCIYQILPCLFLNAVLYTDLLPEVLRLQDMRTDSFYPQCCCSYNMLYMVILMCWFLFIYCDKLDSSRQLTISLVKKWSIMYELNIASRSASRGICLRKSFFMKNLSHTL